ncbi:gliding motility lipoprotein GldH [uncultured Kriegella sp.]|uniref:gliding motility lipoprotein GldH n=1 Tax=uncultured Kriegella sp. TaxID=1798910 RepID=UPI0030DAFF15|tara:strand:+ start:227145 stop:227630 length:486 start_codon:yes stop_codon:yes gene_type:complete
MPKSLFVLAALICVVSCNDALLVSEYKATDKGHWNKDHTIEFTFSEVDTIRRHNMFINIRNDETFPYSNLFLIAELNFPSGETVKDTLEYEMALPDGKWLGKGYGSIKENKLWYKENIVFPSSGVYTLSVSHAMRKNGSVDGIANLPGITDVGFEIVKSNE